MSYLLIRTTELLVFLLIFFVGRRIYKLHTMSKIKPFAPVAVQLTDPKNTNFKATQIHASPEKKLMQF